MRAGLPFAFRTADNHYVLTDKPPANVPAGVSLAKVYSHHQIIELRQEYEAAKAYAPAAADEWLKGLQSRGKSRLADSGRFVRWETALAPGKPVARALREYLRPYAPPSVDVVPTLPAPGHGNAPWYPVPSGKSIQCPCTSDLLHVSRYDRVGCLISSFQ